MTRGRAKDIALIALCVWAIMLTGAIGYGFYERAQDAHSTCVIQARGLPAGHQLAASMKDIYSLLTLRPVSAADRLRAAETPPPVELLVRSLDGHLAAYLKAEAAQPQRRSC